MQSEVEPTKNDLPNLVPTVPKNTTSVEVTLPNGVIFELPIIKPTEGAPMIDVQGLYAKSGHFTFDPGYTVTGSCSSKITYIDGDQGKLFHRGYAIEDLANYGSFMEICFLIQYGILPGKNELEKYEKMIVSEMIIHDRLINLLKSYKSSAHPMAILMGVVGSLSAFDKHTSSYDLGKEDQEAVMTRLLAKIPTIAAMAYRTSRGLPLVSPKMKYGFVENFMRMMFKDPMRRWGEQKVPRSYIKAMEKLLLLHADNEQGASCTTVRIAASSNANPFSCIAAGIASHWGPQQGGADELVIKMLEEIDSEENIPTYLNRAKNKQNGFRLMGFGHRIYKALDPRAVLLKELANELLEESGRKDKYLTLALKLEEAALNDPYFQERKLFPNVDFYSGVIYKIIGIPPEMATVIFCVGRTAGWVGQWLEMMKDPTRKIGRPRQLYVGEKIREYVKIGDREEFEELRIERMPREANDMSLPIL